MNQQELQGKMHQFYQQMISSNPTFQQAAKMCQGKNPQQMQQMIANICQERGINMNQAMQSFNSFMHQQFRG